MQPEPAPRQGRCPFERLRADHDRLLETLNRLEAPQLRRESSGEVDEARVLDVVQQLSRQFETHMTVEDRVLFPLIAEVLTESRVAIGPLREEHDELRAMLADLTQTLDAPRAAARDEQIAVRTRDLTDLLWIHVQKEESVVFDVARRFLPASERERLARNIEAFYAQLESNAPDRRSKGSTT